MKICPGALETLLDAKYVVVMNASFDNYARCRQTDRGEVM